MFARSACSGQVGYTSLEATLAMYSWKGTVTLRAFSAGRPRWTVMVLGITTSSSTCGTAHSYTGAGPLPPAPAYSGWGGISTCDPASSRAVCSTGSAGSKASRATVCCPSNTCTPRISTGCQPSFSASRVYTA